MNAILWSVLGFGIIYPVLMRIVFEIASPRRERMLASAEEYFSDAKITTREKEEIKEYLEMSTNWSTIIKIAGCAPLYAIAPKEEKEAVERKIQQRDRDKERKALYDSIAISMLASNPIASVFLFVVLLPFALVMEARSKIVRFRFIFHDVLRLIEVGLLKSLA